MLSSFGHLLVRAWGAMVTASSTSTFGLGVWTFLLALAVWVAGVVKEWKRLRGTQAQSPFLEAVRTSKETAIYEIGTIVVVALLMWGVFVVRTVYYERMGTACCCVFMALLLIASFRRVVASTTRPKCVGRECRTVWATYSLQGRWPPCAVRSAWRHTASRK
jgi:hypothetical protein